MSRYPTNTATHARYGARAEAALKATSHLSAIDVQHCRNVLTGWLAGSRKPRSGSVLRCLTYLEYAVPGTQDLHQLLNLKVVVS